MINSYLTEPVPTLMDPEPPQPLNPSPGRHKPFPYPTPHVSG